MSKCFVQAANRSAIHCLFLQAACPHGLRSVPSSSCLSGRLPCYMTTASPKESSRTIPHVKGIFVKKCMTYLLPSTLTTHPWRRIEHLLMPCPSAVLYDALQGLQCRRNDLLCLIPGPPENKKPDWTSRHTQAGIGHSVPADTCKTGSGAGKRSGAKSDPVRRRSDHLLCRQSFPDGRAGPEAPDS